MPVHLGSRTKVHLVSADLRSTTTDEPSNKKAPTVTEHIVEVEQMLKNGHVLKESNIPLAGDSNPLHLLGGDEYMPFLFVRAGEDLRHVPATREARAFHPDPARNAIYARILGPDPAAAIKVPQSLALRVELSKQSFLKTDQPLDDIRMDVLFNGQLTHSTMCSKRFYQEDKKPEQLLSVFSGLRFHWMLERAWVIVPPGQDPDGSRRRPVAISDTLEDRWEKIQKEVRKEASARKLDKDGNRPVVAKYLMELAKLPMPAELKKWSEPRGQAFGVIDVVLSYGRGFKDTPAKVYLSEPTRMRSSKFKHQEKAEVFDGIPLKAEVGTGRTTGRYNLRTASPDTRLAGKRTPAMARIPMRQRPGKTSSRVPLFEQSDTLPGPSVEREGNTITSSEKLPRYLSEEMTKKGYVLQVGPPLEGSPAKTKSDKATESHKERLKGQDQQFHFRSPRATNRPSGRHVEQLRGIPEEDEAFTTSNLDDVVTSSGTGSQPLGTIKMSSSMPLASSESSDMTKTETAPLSSSMPEMQTGSSSLRGPLLPPIQIQTGVRARRMADQDEGGSPRKKRRLSGGFSPLDIQKAERGLGVTNRGVFTALGSPLDKSPRSLFNSFTVGSRIDLDPAGPRRRPPTSPLTPNQNIDQQKEDPMIWRLVIKKSKDEVIRTLNINNPFRLSQLPSVAAAAEGRTNGERVAEGKLPFPKVALLLPPPSPVFPSTPQQPIPAISTQTIPSTPVPHRTKAHIPSSGGSSTYPVSGGIHNTPNPLPRYPSLPTTQSPYFTSQPQTPTAPATTTTRNNNEGDSGSDSSYAPPSTRATPNHNHRRRIPSSATATPAARTATVVGSAGGSTGGTTTTTTGRTRATLRPDDPRHPHAQMEKLFRAFEPPDLTRDCAIAYAQPGLPPQSSTTTRAQRLSSGAAGAEKEWEEGQPRAFGGGVVRQVRSERTGEFEEEGVLVGVRFLVV